METDPIKEDIYVQKYKELGVLVPFSQLINGQRDL